MRKLILLLALVMLTSFGMVGVATAHGTPMPHDHYYLQTPDSLGLWGMAGGDKGVWVILRYFNPGVTNENDRHLRMGFQVNVPPGFEITHGIARPVTTPTKPVEGGGAPPSPVQQAGIGLPGWLWALLIGIGVIVLLLFALLSRMGGIAARHAEEAGRLQQTLVDTHRQHQIDLVEAEADAIEQERRQRRTRVRQNPYAGPAVIASGLPTGNMAANYLIDLYRRRYPNPDGADRLVQLLRVEPIWVRGANMQVGYAGDVTRRRDLVSEQPSWRGIFSNGVVLDVLQRCANGLFSEIGQQLRDDQVRQRDGVPVVEVNRLVWPEPVNQPVVSEPPPTPPVVATVVSTEPPIPPILRTILPVDDSLPPNLVTVNELPVYDGISSDESGTRLHRVGTEVWDTFDSYTFPGAEIAIVDGIVGLRVGDGARTIGRWQNPPEVGNDGDHPVIAEAPTSVPGTNG
ncbi:MAG: hypothetical protein WC734_03045 [Patescibacteria group bacterium]|jgi:hypothetical protein